MGENGAEKIAEEIMEAQADPQSALGLLWHHGTLDEDQHDRLSRSLARLHALLAAMGRPMYEPATHPDVPALAALSTSEEPT